MAGVAEVWPGCVIQWEDFKRHQRAAHPRPLPGPRAVVQRRHPGNGGGRRRRGPGRAARARARRWPRRGSCWPGPGAAGIGIARLLRLAMLEDGMPEAAVRRALVLVDSHGLVPRGSAGLDPTKRELALPGDAFAGYGFASEVADLVETIERVRPTVLVGTTAVGGTFTEAAIRAMAAGDRPADRHAAVQSDLGRRGDADRRPALDRRPGARGDRVTVRRGRGGRAPPRDRPGEQRVHLPGPRARRHRRRGRRRSPTGCSCSPPGPSPRPSRPSDSRPGRSTRRSAALRAVTRAIAVAVAREAIDAGLAGVPADTDVDALIDDAMWWPAYVPYVPVRHAERRRAGET